MKTETMLQELQQVVSDFYFKKMEEEADKWWDENNMSNEKLDKMLNSHYHSYKLLI